MFSSIFLIDSAHVFAVNTCQNFIERSLHSISVKTSHLLRLSNFFLNSEFFNSNSSITDACSFFNLSKADSFASQAEIFSFKIFNSFQKSSLTCFL